MHFEIVDARILNECSRVGYHRALLKLEVTRLKLKTFLRGILIQLLFFFCLENGAKRPGNRKAPELCTRNGHGSGIRLHFLDLDLNFREKPDPDPVCMVWYM